MIYVANLKINILKHIQRKYIGHMQIESTKIIKTLYYKNGLTKKKVNCEVYN